MSKINKIITNYPVELTPEEVENLSLTLSAVRTAGGGGGGGEGKIYHGEGFVTVNNTSNAISLTTEANEKLNQSIPTKVSDLTDSADYQTVAGMSDYSTKAVADTLYAPISVTGDIDTLKSSSGDWDKVSEKLDTTAFSTVSGNFLTAHQSLDDYYTKTQVDSTFASATQLNNYLTTAQYQTDSATFALKTEIPTTVAQLTDSENYYLKTETSGISELNTAFGNKQDNLTQEQLSAISSVSSIKGTVLAGDANIRTTSAKVGNNVKWTLELTAQPVVTDTTLSGHNGIVAVKDSSVSSQWNISIAQAYKERIEEVSGKLDTSAAASTYQTKTDMSNYLTTAVYEADSATFLTAHQSLSNYYQKSETSGANELATEFAKYVTSSDITTQDTDYVMTTTGWKVLTLPGGGMTEVIHDTTLTGQGNDNNSKLGVAWSALSGNTINSAKSAGSAVSAYIAEYYYKANNEPQNIATVIDRIDNANTQLFADVYSYPEYLPRETPIYADYAMSAYISENNVSGFNDFANAINVKLDTTAAAQTYLTTATYATDSATFVTSSSNTITGTKQYALTTAGWTAVSIPTIPDITANNGLSANGHTVGISTTNMAANKQYAFTTNGWAEVSTPTIPDITANNGLSANEHTIGIDNTDLIANTQYAWTTTGWTSVETAYLPTSGGTVSGQLVVSGGSSFDQQFLKITRENVNGYARLGLGQYGALALKTDDNNSHTTQVNISPNAANDQLVQVQHNGNTVGYLIPAVTATTTDGLTNDGILHIILES
ncbi:MAG: hypothetical protein J6T34_04785 [Bacilli bacterium]|nr:hypothetical protein [Bacilli bacterium]